jgi:hypothetical protein
MVILNSGVIYHLIHLRRTSTIRNSSIRHCPITFTLVTTTFLFLIMTILATLADAFFNKADANILRSFDGILYTYYILSFPLYLITFDEFRREFICLLTCKNCSGKVQPQMDIRIAT